MSINAIISYDGTDNDRDALALASVLGEAGANPVLAYVRHSVRHDGHERLEADDAQVMLDRANEALGGTADTRVVVHSSTAAGLKALAESEDASLVVFGSAYRTPKGRISQQKTTETMLENGNVAVAIAPAGYEARDINTIGLMAGLDDHAAIDTAHSIATAFGATVTDETKDVDLLIVGSRPEAQHGRVLVSAEAQNAIEGTSAPVLVVARGVAVGFSQQLYVA